MTIDRRRRVAVVLASLGTALVLACSSSGLDDNNDDLPRPTLYAGDPLATCGAAGGVPIELDLLRTVVTTGYGGPAPTPVNNVDVRGTVTGLPATDEVYVALVALEGPCDILATAKATVDPATGDLRAFVNLSTEVEFHVVAISGTSDPGGAIGCTASGCLDLTDDVGALLTVSGLSNTLDVRLE